MTQRKKTCSSETSFDSWMAWVDRKSCFHKLIDLFGYIPLVKSKFRLEPLLYKDPVSLARKKYHKLEAIVWANYQSFTVPISYDCELISRQKGWKRRPINVTTEVTFERGGRHLSGRNGSSCERWLCWRPAARWLYMRLRLSSWASCLLRTLAFVLQLCSRSATHQPDAYCQV